MPGAPRLCGGLPGAPTWAHQCWQSHGKPPRRDDAIPESIPTCGSLRALPASPLPVSHGGAEGGQPPARLGGQMGAVCQHPVSDGALAAPPWQRKQSHNRRLEAERVAARRAGSGAEPGVPSQPRPQVPVPCAALGRLHQTQLSGRAKRGGGCAIQRCLPRSAITGGPVRARGSSAPRGGQGALAPCSSPPSSLMQKQLGEPPSPQLPSPSYLSSRRLVLGSVTLCYLSQGSSESRLREQLPGKGAGRKEGDGRRGEGQAAAGCLRAPCSLGGRKEDVL